MANRSGPRSGDRGPPWCEVVVSSGGCAVQCGAGVWCLSVVPPTYRQVAVMMGVRYATREPL